VRQWLELAWRQDVRNRALKVAALVGTILMLINQGDLLLAGGLTADIAIKILLTYCVPYCVSTYAGVEALRDRSTEPGR
jgi:hypothetical protein